MKTIILICAFAGVLSLAYGSDFAQCKHKMEPVGCYNDKPADRAMGDLIAVGNDPNHPKFSGNMVTWQNYDAWLENFMCICAQRAFDLGHRMIGVQYFTECWSHKDASANFDKHGSSSNCVTADNKPCGNDNNVCHGGASTNFVYRIAPPSCTTYYKPIGCYKDTNVDPRPLPTYAMNERDYTIPNWNNHLIDWKNWNNYSQEMICRCAIEARKRMHSLFAIQFYGECWTGKSYVSNYKRDGATDRCIAKAFDPPRTNSYIAVGKDHANYVYQLSSGPSQ